MPTPSLQALTDMVERRQAGEVGLAPLEGFDDKLGSQFMSRPTGEPRFAGEELMVNPYTGAPLKSEPIFGGKGRVSEAYATPSDQALHIRNPFMEENLSEMEQRQSAAEIREIQKTMTNNKRIEAQKQFQQKWRAIMSAKERGGMTPAMIRQVDAAFQRDMETFDSPDPMELFGYAEAEADPKVKGARLREAIRYTTNARFGDENFANMMAEFVEPDPKTGQPRLSEDGMQLYKMQENIHLEQRKIDAEFNKNKSYRFNALQSFLSELEKDDEDGKAVYLETLAAYKEDFGNIPGEEPTREGKFNKAEELKYLLSGRVKPAQGKSKQPVLRGGPARGVRDVVNAADKQAIKDEIAAARQRGDMKFKIFARDPATGSIVIYE